MKVKNISADNIRAIELLYNKEREISAIRMKTTDGFIYGLHIDRVILRSKETGEETILDPQ